MAPAGELFATALAAKDAAGRELVSYLLRVTKSDQDYLVEQQAYYNCGRPDHLDAGAVFRLSAADT